MYADLVRTIGRTRGFARIASRVLPPLDLAFRGRRRSITSLATGFPLCYLTTTGRRSGRQRTVPLLYVDGDGDCIALIGSNWGKPRPPGWALNLGAHGDVVVTIDGRARGMRARPASADERSRYWQRALALWPAYEAYRRRAGREIPIFVLEARAATESGTVEPVTR